MTGRDKQNYPRLSKNVAITIWRASADRRSTPTKIKRDHRKTVSDQNRTPRNKCFQIGRASNPRLGGTIEDNEQQ